MMRRRGWRWHLIWFFWVSLAVWVAERVEGRTGADVLVVLPQQFLPTNGAVHYSIGGGGLGLLCTVQHAAYFVAPVPLPTGVRIQRVEAVFDDSAEDAFGVVTLWRIGERVRDLLALTPVSLARPLREISAVDLAEPEIVRRDFQYWLHLTLTGPDVCLRAVRVHYAQD